MPKILLFVLLFLSSNVFAQTPEQIIQKIYPNYSKKHQCYRVEDDYLGVYCVRPREREIRKTEQGKFMYLLYTGDHFNKFDDMDDINKWPYSTHAQGGLVGFFVLKQQSDNDWILIASAPYESIGSWGRVPDWYPWTFLEFGKDKWGFLTMTNYLIRGEFSEEYVLLHHNGGHKIGVSLLEASYFNYPHYGDKCEIYEDEPKRQKNCIKNILTSLESELKILHDQTPTGGFYPIQITVDGHVGEKTYHQQIYRIHFDAKSGKYIEPDNYAFKENVDSDD